MIERYIRDGQIVPNEVTCGLIVEAMQVRKTPSWPRSWANFSPL
jgi:hypothetical protein